MAELLLQIGGALDGDVLAATPWRAIRSMHASLLCSRHVPVNGHGYRPLGSLAETYMREGHKHRIAQTGRYTAHVAVQAGWTLDDGEVRERDVTGPEFDVVIGSNPVRTIRYPELAGKRKTLETAVEIVASGYGVVGIISWAKGQSKNTWAGIVLIDAVPTPFTMTLLSPIAMHVDEYFDARLWHADTQGNPRHVVFGDTPDRAVYYDGRQDYSPARLDTIWADITARTGKRDSEFPHNNLSQLQLKTSLVLPVADFDDETAAGYLQPLTRDTGTVDEFGQPVLETIAERKYKVAWRGLFPLDIPPSTKADDVLDVRRPVDPRRRAGPPFDATTLLQEKVA